MTTWRVIVYAVEDQHGERRGLHPAAHVDVPGMPWEQAREMIARQLGAHDLVTYSAGIIHTAPLRAR